MERISTKQESRKKIEELDLNRVPEIFVEANDNKTIKHFFDTYSADLYVIRSADYSSAKYYYVHDYKEYISISNKLNGKIIIAISINSYKNKVLLGAIEMEHDRIRLCATTNQDLDHRTMYGTAEYNYDLDICDKKLNDVPYIDYLVAYLYNNGLMNLTVEFTIYDKNVGIKNQPIIINEIRNY